MGYQVIFVFAVSFIVSLVFTRAAIPVANMFGIIDLPDERKRHPYPTPLLGGVAIFAGYSVSVLINFHFSTELKGVMVASGIMLLMGLADDIKDLPAALRLIGQVICAFIVIACGVRINIIPDRFIYAETIETLITVIWMVGVTNALNFLDGADGLAAGITAIASGAFFVIAYGTGQTYFAFLTIALTGACIGFLVFNSHPARIFLGDAGSSFIGFSLASLAVMGDWAEGYPLAALSVPLLTLAVLIFDMVYITVARVARGRVKTLKEYIEYTGRDHLHHRLMALGFSQRQAVIFIYLICLIFALGAVVLSGSQPAQSLVLLLQGVFILITVAILMVVGRRSLEQTGACPGDPE